MSERQQRVVADGWGAQSSGNVFCADSSLRYIYETANDHSTSSSSSAASAISSLTAHHEQQQVMTMDAQKTSTTTYFPTYPLLQQKQNPLMAMNEMKQPQQSTTFAGKRPRENSSDTARIANADGVDLYEAEIARACTAIHKQVPSLPHSFRECSVCLTSNAYAQIALCGHTFHSKCFLRWFRMNRSCPLCRGEVDKIQLAAVVSVQDELEAIMAEIDDEPLPVDKSLDASDALLGNPELISFLESDFDTDMEMVALNDVLTEQQASHHSHAQGSVLETNSFDGFVSRQDDSDSMDVDMDMDDQTDKHQQSFTIMPKPEINTTASNSSSAPTNASFFTPTSMQFAPSSTMPNYWNVLNQGLTSIPPTLPATVMPSHQSSQRMVHIAPKPDARALQGNTTTNHHHQLHHQHQHHHHHLSLAHQRHAPSTVEMISKVTPSFQARSVTPPAPRVVSCRCTGGCRNGRCACVKDGGMCGVSCRCTSCKNPFLMVKEAGADIDSLLKDSCFMHNVSKTRDMVQRLQEDVTVPCCQMTIKVIDCVQGYTCTACQNRVYDFSWCMNKLLDHDRTPRNHCEICKRCSDHRDVHCSDCGRCYFAGVAASLPCPCKEQMSHKKRKELGQDNNNHARASPASGEDDQEGETEGECSIM